MRFSGCHSNIESYHRNKSPHRQTSIRSLLSALSGESSFVIELSRLIMPNGNRYVARVFHPLSRSGGKRIAGIPRPTLHWQIAPLIRLIAACSCHLISAAPLLLDVFNYSVLCTFHISFLFLNKWWHTFRSIPRKILCCRRTNLLVSLWSTLQVSSLKRIRVISDARHFICVCAFDELGKIILRSRNRDCRRGTTWKREREAAPRRTFHAV